MALSGHVFNLQDVAWVQNAFGAVSDTDLHLASQDDDVLDPWRVMPIAEAAIRETTKVHVGASREGYGLRLPSGHVQVLEVGLAIVTGV